MAQPLPRSPMALPSLSLSPASASASSSSTLIVTPLPSSSSSSSLPPKSEEKQKEKRLSLGLTISTPTHPQTQTQTPVQAKMSARGFVEPHHSHLPRRTRAKAKTTSVDLASHLAKQMATEKEASLDSKHSAAPFTTPAPTPTTNSRIDDSHPAFLPTSPSPAPGPPPPLSRSRSSFPPRSLFPGLHDAPANDETPPTHLLSLKLPPSPPPELNLGSRTTPPRPTPTPLTSTALALSLGLGFNPNLGSPTPATPGSAPVHTPMNKGPLHGNLPRRTARARARVRAGTAPSHQHQQTARAQARTRSTLPADVRADAQLDERRESGAGAGAGAGSSEETQDGTDGGEAEGLIPEEPATPTPARAQVGGSARLMIGQGQGQRRHLRRGGVLDSDRAGKAHISPAVGLEAGVDVEAEVEAVAKAEAKAKTKEDMLEERACIQPIGYGTGVEVGFLSSACVDGAAEELEEDGFWGLPPRLDGLEPEVGTGTTTTTTTTDNDKPNVDDNDNDIIMEKLRWARMRKVVLRVVMDHDDDDGADGGLDCDDGHERRGGGDARIGGMTGATTSDGGSTVGGEDYSVDTTPPMTQSCRSESPVSSPNPERVLQPPRELELELDLPTDLTAYKEGETALTSEQMVDAFAFIGRHLAYAYAPPLPPLVSGARTSDDGASTSTSTDTDKRKRTKPKKKIRILTPRARPEDAMSLAVGYLAYTSSSLSASSTVSHCEHELDVENPYTRPHLLWMHLMDYGADMETDSRGSETGRGGDAGPDANANVGVDVDANANVDANVDAEVVNELPQLDRGIRDEWRGVLSYDGLMKVHSAFASAGSDSSSDAGAAGGGGGPSIGV
ncbi:hypothetical protein GALMADRAFT_214870 [Galerina marginata CBS 339.88]|uniref:Uncharacterized protein n=1 Tax=Galerina marginata (strain CBS 339.88) TaxID=685588 RepID=A0A067SFP5_GALM3|nr:hypothetical protein GALMADRAFT_214870 [Galerina marginata CBS 339.88]